MENLNLNGGSNERRNNKIVITQRYIENFFEKKFMFNKDRFWGIYPSCYRWLFPRENYHYHYLQSLKFDLNQIKSRLNNFPLEDWSKHTRRRNPAGDVVWKVKNQTKAEFVTQAWCKFYECLNQYPVVNSSKLNSVHLCEAPGAFIAALNHYLHSNYNKVEWNWLASTLNPYYEGNPLGDMVVDDRFILHTLDKWVFGKDFTGNIIDPVNINHICNEIKSKFNNKPINLVTADGSIDCVETPDQQEEIVYPLHYAELCTAFKLLSNNGNFILKMFTLFESSAISILYLLNCLFNEVHVYKPCTSKCGNSEVYVICLNFQKSKIKDFDNFCVKLVENLHNTTIFPPSLIPLSFLMQHIECAEYFAKFQMNAITSNINSYLVPTQFDMKRCRLIRSAVCDFYFSKYNIHEIPLNRTILYNLKVTIQYEFHAKLHTGSYSDRLNVKQLSNSDKIPLFKRELTEIYGTYEYKDENLIDMNLQLIEYHNVMNVMNFNGSNDNEIKCALSIYYGKPFKVISNSLFLSAQLMHFCNRIYQADKNVWSFQNYCYYIDDKFYDKFDSNFILYEKYFFIKLMNNIVNASVSSSPSPPVVENNSIKLRLIQIPLLTHFSASIIKYFISNIFEKCFFDIANLEIQFSNLQNNAIVNLQELLSTIKSNFNENNNNNNNEIENGTYSNDINVDGGDDDDQNKNTILCCVNIKELHQNNFNHFIKKYNDNLIIKNCKSCLEN